MAMENITSSLGMDERSQNEGNVTSKIEHVTARTPPVGYLIAAGGCAVASAALFVTRQRHWSLFVGEWVPSILLLGVYNKIVKATEPIA